MWRATHQREVRIGVAEAAIHPLLAGAGRISPGPGNEFGEPERKALEFRVADLPLISEEDDLGLKQRLIDGVDHLIGQGGRRLDFPDFGADPGRPLHDISARDNTLNISESPNLFMIVLSSRRVCTKLRRAPVAESGGGG